MVHIMWNSRPLCGVVEERALIMVSAAEASNATCPQCIAILHESDEHEAQIDVNSHRSI